MLRGRFEFSFFFFLLSKETVKIALRERAVILRFVDHIKCWATYTLTYMNVPLIIKLKLFLQRIQEVRPLHGIQHLLSFPERQIKSQLTQNMICFQSQYSWPIYISVFYAGRLGSERFLKHIFKPFHGLIVFDQRKIYMYVFSLKPQHYFYISPRSKVK